MEFDRTRKAIGAEQLGSKDRKELMQKLAGAGGEVLSERALQKQREAAAGGASGSGSGRGGGAGAGGGRGGVDVRLPSQLARERMLEEGERAAQIRRLREQEEKAATSFFARLGLKIRCKMRGLAPYGADMVMPRFLSRLNLDAKRAIMECQILGNDLFLSNRKTAVTIVKELDQKNPLLAELLQRAADLYDRNELSELVAGYSPSAENSVSIDSMRAPMFSLLRRLYYLKPFQETYLNAAEIAIDIQEREERKQSSLYSLKKKRIRSEWLKLMNDIYPDLALLAQRAEMKRCEPGSRLFEEMIGFDPGQRVGNRKAGEPLSNRLATKQEEKKAEESAQQDQEKQEEAAQNEVKETQENKELLYGYRLMRILTLSALRAKLDPKGEWKELDDRDKVLIAYLFFREFEEEYSFILTTPQIKINASYQGGVKIDYRQKMRDVYEESRITEEHYRKYLHEATEYRKVVGEQAAPQNYVEHAKKVSLLESRRGVSGREVRVSMKDHVDKVSELLKALIADMRGAKQIIANRDDPIKFEIERDRRKRLNGKPVKDCIMQAYCFTIALSDRLANGDLFGGVLEMSEEDFQNAFVQPE